MATLEKIRSKSVLLLVVIGVALLAFIIGDFFNSANSIFGNATTVAKVDGKKLKIDEFQKKYNEQSQAMQQYQQHIDASALQQEVLDQMINEKLLENQMKGLGIEVTDKELSDYLLGDTPMPAAMQFAQSVGVQTPAQLHDMLFNSAKYNLQEQQVAPLRQQWLMLEAQTLETLRQQKLMLLLNGALQANKLDIEAMKANDIIYPITLAKKDFNSLSDADFPVDEKEIKDLYNKKKNQFKLLADVRKVSYISVNIVPSTEDEITGKTLMDTAIVRLNNNPGTETVSNISELSVREYTTTLAKAKGDVKTFLEGASVGQVSETNRSGNVLSVIKLIGKKVETDSVKLNMVVVEGNKQVQDSVLNLLNSGMTLAEVEKVNGVAQVQEDQNIDLTNLNASDVEAKDKVLNAPADYFSLQSTDQYGTLCKVVSKSTPKTLYDVAEVSYTVYPSQATKDALYNKLADYVAENNTSETFKANADKSGYQAIDAYITSDMPMIGAVPDVATANRHSLRMYNMLQMGGLQGSRSSVVWAFSAKKGEVSAVSSESSDRYIVVAVDDIIPAGFIPVTDPVVNEELTAEIRDSKKAEKLISEFKGKANDVAGYAAAMGVSVDSINVSFSSTFLPAVGMDTKFVGIVSGSEPGKVTGPVAGNQAVYVFDKGNTEASVELSNVEAANRYRAIFGGQAVMRNFAQVLRQNVKIENNLDRFFNTQR